MPLLSKMGSDVRNVIVIGGSYVGMGTAEELSKILPARYRVLLIEPHLHFHHLFVVPRFAVAPSHQHKAFIPYTSAFRSALHPSAQHGVVSARVTSLESNHAVLDHEWEGSTRVPFDYAVVASGTTLQPPATVPCDDKKAGTTYLESYQKRVAKAESIIIIGGGAVGVQMATDIKELFPDKNVTLVHSRHQLMPVYHEQLSDMIKSRFDELGVNYRLGSRVVVPPGGWPQSDNAVHGKQKVQLQDGSTLEADMVIPAMGQTPNTDFLSGLLSSSNPSAPSKSDLISQTNGFIRVNPTLQFRAGALGHIFAAGDVADSGAHKAARPGVAQAKVVAANILALIEGKAPQAEVEVGPPGIHLWLGITKSVIFRNPNPAKGIPNSVVTFKDDGSEDMSVGAFWNRRGFTIKEEADYYL